MSLLLKRGAQQCSKVNLVPLVRLSVSQQCNYGDYALHTLSDNPGAKPKKKRRGRGPNNPVGKGKKGLNIRQGTRKPHRGFEGGQTPIHRAAPRFFYHRYDHNAPLDSLDLTRLQHYLDTDRLNAKKVITMRELYQSKCCTQIRWGLALTNKSGLKDFRHKINIEVSFVTPAAKQAIEDAGGIVRLKYYHRHMLRWLIKPHLIEFLPTSQLDTLPKPRHRHMYPDYPQLPVAEELRYLKKYQVHPGLLPKNVGAQEKKDQEHKLAMADYPHPQPYFMQHTSYKDKLFRWAKHQ